MPQDVSGDFKDMKVAGHDVHLVFSLSAGRWTVVGTLSSGTAENKNAETITSGPWATRDLAEQKALERITELLGHNEDRNTSRVNNPGELTEKQIPEQEPTGEPTRATTMDRF